MEIGRRLAWLSAGLCGVFPDPRRCDRVLPYPFINVSNLGYDKVLTNMAVLVFVFLGLGVALIGIDRRMGRGNEQAAGMAT
jgi:hypothetical protein